MTPPASLTPLPTQTDTANITAFLAAAVQRYHDGINCGGFDRAPDLGLSEADFLSLSIESGTVLSFGGRRYLFKAVPDYYVYIDGTLNLEGYTVSFKAARPGVTATGGGYDRLVGVYQDSKLLAEKEYSGTVLNFGLYSMGAERQQLDAVTLLSIYYVPECNSLDGMTFVLVPVPATGP